MNINLTTKNVTFSLSVSPPLITHGVHFPTHTRENRPTYNRRIHQIHMLNVQRPKNAVNEPQNFGAVAALSCLDHVDEPDNLRRQQAKYDKDRTNDSRSYESLSLSFSRLVDLSPCLPLSSSSLVATIQTFTFLRSFLVPISKLVERERKGGSDVRSRHRQDAYRL